MKGFHRAQSRHDNELPEDRFDLFGDDDEQIDPDRARDLQMEFDEEPW